MGSWPAGLVLLLLISRFLLGCLKSGPWALPGLHLETKIQVQASVRGEPGLRLQQGYL